MFDIFSLKGLMFLSLLAVEEQKRNKEKKEEQIVEQKQEQFDDELSEILKELKEIFNGNVC